jgi:hypothetical protein
MNLTKEPAGLAYRVLLRRLSTISEEFRLVIEDWHQRSEGTIALQQKLSDHLIGEAMVTEWPGTQLLNGKVAQLFRYRSNELSVAPLLETTNGFGDWGGLLPEDLHFVRGDGSPLLASTTSEAYVWLQLTLGEQRILQGSTRGYDLVGEYVTGRSCCTGLVLSG